MAVLLAEVRTAIQHISDAEATREQFVYHNSRQRANLYLDMNENAYILQRIDDSRVSQGHT